MSKPATDFNVANGLMGVGPDMMLEIIHEMTSIRDVQQFLGISKATKSLIQHERFSWSTETAAADRTGTKALVCKRLPHVAIVVDPQLTEERKGNLERYIFDVTKEPELKLKEEQRIKSLCIQYKNLRIDNNSSFFAWGIIYVDGLGTLRKKLIDFGDYDDIKEKRPLAEKWINDIQMPPASVKFTRVKSGGNFTMALTEGGELWSRGWNEAGSWTEEEKFTLNYHFKGEGGLIDSSLGKSRIKDFHFEGVRSVVILENGAILLFGSTSEFQPYDSSIPSDGFVEITDKKYKPKFIKELSGDVDSSAGQYGIFGTHKPVKYFKRMNAFLDENGIVLLRVVDEVDRKNQFYYTAVDPKYFGGEKIINMNHHVDEMYITESGKMIITNGMRGTADIATDLKNPKATRQMDFSVKRLKVSILTKHTHTTLFRDDGKLISVDLEKEGTKDVTDFATELSVDEVNPSGMVLKWYGHCGVQYYFLYE
ncbi:uncharacterized protein MONOS_13094 [Monocercomonoides exilis]|uniref:uncharacterized protein n=1 Tax=Monocercomonoides exilis TaxID=2049356 RepID=UPI00355A6E07|nr:hypothetical protein MONOS_13094 [Monocercomonoides exilis]|eukprot:MONOS_13094.1-p1 / transcript=MONOS_13094.1 / gene=MONOS_13094 / organism=Monocercomonoides_exilis_PA203 / gene_product=unspecified product / transcript_product=unspecified product / location=Mono_scaffold00777:18143-19640(-) / protein_length=480 / sequence_SO=supercontig / SO=protein_coding / is_pseudo=false